MWSIFKKKEKLNKQWLWYATAAYVVMLIVNGLAGSTTIIGGVDTAQISDSYPNLFAPAGFTFSIWGVIYALLAVFLFRSFKTFQTAKPRLETIDHNRLLKLFTYTSIVNVLWLFAWQYNWLLLSVVLMLVLLVLLLKIVYPLSAPKLSSLEAASVRTPFMVYAGWISVATIANITTWLVSVEWNQLGIGGSAWMVIISIVGVAIAVAAAFRLRNIAFLAVFVWAYMGILVKHFTVFDAQYLGVITALAIALSTLVAAGISLFASGKYCRCDT